ncbi:flagellin [Fictibacillus enclensis]|uniref:Flagellin n=1 Tax=Fictibacillus enclensis TaxID=1017270 RepID=A0A0V8J7J4_9BACL|nr:flagellin [Fictibacillus enclensis]KSU83103.1 flagellin [Fictibacillus enclensis]SCC10131.1 flagellin [Fictibacillus enclensis]
MQINHNIAALNTFNKLNSATNAQSKSMEKLSSGLRINRAGDDAAGLAISEKMRGQIRGLDQASRNAQDGISMIQTAEGALNETHDILQRMRELSVQASNDTNTLDDRQSIGDEIFELKKEIDRISETTKFNGKGLLNGDMSTSQDATSTAKLGVAIGAAVISKVDVSGAVAGTSYTFADGTAADGKLTMNATVNGKTVSETVNVGANSQTLNFSSLGISIELAGTETSTNIEANLSGKTIVTATGSGNATFLVGSNGEAAEKITVDFKKMDTTTLGSGGANNIADKVTDNTAVNTVGKADALTAVLDNAIKQVSQQRSNLGANQNRLEHTINNLSTSSENLTAAESRIRDVDYALAA